MSALDLDAIQACTDAATPGPWEPTGRTPEGNIIIWGNTGFPFDQTLVANVRRDDAEFVSAARVWVPALVARVRELEAERDSELPRIAVWISDARRTFEAIERFGVDLTRSSNDFRVREAGHNLLALIGDRFRTRPPEVSS